jgi:hypothetical protein
MFIIAESLLERKFHGVVQLAEVLNEGGKSNP